MVEWHKYTHNFIISIISTDDSKNQFLNYIFLGYGDIVKMWNENWVLVNIQSSTNALKSKSHP